MDVSVPEKFKHDNVCLHVICLLVSAPALLCININAKTLDSILHMLTLTIQENSNTGALTDPGFLFSL